jgi:(2Fe-2S) ferredoxin
VRLCICECECECVLCVYADALIWFTNLENKNMWSDNQLHLESNITS